MFVDRIRIRVTGGRGGNGCVSFRREIYVPRGGPNGGNGGGGGSVRLRASKDVQSLEAYHYKAHFDAENGKHGSGKDQHGRRGQDVTLTVPIGTLVKDLENDGELLADLNADGMEFVAAQGGRGGRGNASYLSSTHQAPREFEEGHPGQERYLELELKCLADVGLVGYPNAGKSTLLGAVSNAHPAVAPYPFTTLTPHIGTIELDNFYRFTIADIPGLIEGAHRNIGLGHDFLRHIERTRVLIYVLDTAGVDGREPWDDLATLMNELECYQRGMSQRPAFIVANKMDLPEAAEKLAVLRTLTPLRIFPVSAKDGIDLAPVLQTLREMLDASRQKDQVKFPAPAPRSAPAAE